MFASLNQIQDQMVLSERTIMTLVSLRLKSVKGYSELIIYYIAFETTPKNYVLFYIACRKQFDIEGRNLEVLESSRVSGATTSKPMGGEIHFRKYRAPDICGLRGGNFECDNYGDEEVIVRDQTPYFCK